MGGTVAETIREEDGNIIKMARKTGAYNWMFFSKEFNQKDFKKAVEDHTKIWFEMRGDFISGPKYTYPMSPVYGFHEEVLKQI